MPQCAEADPDACLGMTAKCRFCGQDPVAGYAWPQLIGHRGGRCESCWHLLLAHQHGVTFTPSEQTRIHNNTPMGLSATVPDRLNQPQTIEIWWDHDYEAPIGQRNPTWRVGRESAGQYLTLHQALSRGKAALGYILDHHWHNFKTAQLDPLPPPAQRPLQERSNRDQILTMGRQSHSVFTDKHIDVAVVCQP